MSQHSMTFHDILQKNVRHIYSGSADTRNFRNHRKLHGNNTAPSGLERRPCRPGRFLENLPHHGISLPRAPAFRVVCKSEMEDIVSRVSRETTSRQRTPGKKCSREIYRDLMEGCGTCQMAITGRKVSSSDLGFIISRLMRPTKCTEIRGMMRTANVDDVYARRPRPCTALERSENPGGSQDCCFPCRIIKNTNRSRLHTILMWTV